MKYYIYVDSRDDVHIPIRPDPVPLHQVGKVIELWLGRFIYQGYFSNARCEQIALDDLTFTIEGERSFNSRIKATV